MAAGTVKPRAPLRPWAYLSAASVRFFTPSFEKRCWTWNFTVLSDRPSRSAICGLVRPPATSAQTSRSRGVKSPGAAGRPSIQRRAAWGNTSWPACTCRIAVSVCCGDSVLRARPSAPASSAERSDSPSLYAVRTSTLGALARSRSAASTAVPLMLVSSRSSTTTSGLCCSTSRSTSVPSVVQAATLMSGSPSSSARSPSSTIAWSSASSTRITIRASFRRQGDGERRAATRGAFERERAAEHRDPILDAAQPEVPALDADVFLLREHPLGLEAATVVRDGQRDRRSAPLDTHALARGPRVAVSVGQRFLQDPVDRDLRGQRAGAELARQLELDGLVREGLVLDRQTLDDLAQLAPLA